MSTRPSSDVELRPGSFVAERYVVEKLIGRGGFGAVYGARHTRLNQPVAIKVLRRATADDPETVERFEREARTVARLRCENIVHVHDSGELPDGRLYYVMERVPGESLAALLQDGPLPPRRAAHIAGQICRALEVAHAAGVVHRDLKPENVMVELTPTGDDRVRVLDFGIARVTTEDTLTEPGVLLGTPAAIAPEVWQGAPATAAADLYALGVMLFHMLTGRPPFTASEPVGLMYQHVQEPAPALELDAPDTLGLATLVSRLLAKAPEDRPADAREVRDVLAPGPGSVAPPVEVEPRWPTRPVWIGAVVLLLAGVVSWLALTPAPQSQAPRPGPIAATTALDAGAQPSPIDATTPDARRNDASAPAATQVLLHSEPTGAQIRVRGRPVGRTPRRIAVSGPLRVELSKPGYYARSLVLRPGQPRVNARLEAVVGIE